MTGRPTLHGFAAILLVAATSACSTMRTPSTADPLGSAVQQPFRDLSLVRQAAPEALVRAAAAPYRPLPDCASIRTGIAELDALLGPDVDTPARQEGSGAGLAGDIVRGAASLPFRGVVRRISGAHERDQAVEAAVLAAMVRRGFLKGEMSGLGCPPMLAR